MVSSLVLVEDKRLMLADGRPSLLAKRERLIALGVALALCLAAAASVLAHGRSVASALADSDFAAFYCAGTLAREGQDPYHWAPLRACELMRVREPSTPASSQLGALDPAPIPGYAIAAFVPLSLLPYRLAVLVWYALLVAAAIASVALLRRSTGLPDPTIAAVLVGTVIVASLTYGQIAPLALLALVAAVLWLSRGRSIATAAATTLTLVQPQTGIAAVLALFIWAPRSRLPLVAFCAGLAGLSIATIGWRANLEYLSAVIPAQALAEAPARIQLSATWLLYFCGVPESLAVRIAQAQYVVMLLLGVALAPRVARALMAPQAVLFFPALVVLVGGTYLHVFQLAAATPFVLLVAGRSQRVRAPALIAAGLLAVPWQALGSRSMLGLAALAVAVLAWFATQRRTLPIRVAFAVLCAVLVALEPRAVAFVPDTPLRALQGAGAFSRLGLDPSLASTEHGLELRRHPERVAASWRALAEKTPYWIALLAALALGVLAATSAAGDPKRRPRPRTPRGLARRTPAASSSRAGPGT